MTLTGALGQTIDGCHTCYKVIMVITGGAYCIKITHNCMYILHYNKYNIKLKNQL